METITLTTPDMSCGHCVAAIEKRLGGLDGVSSVKATLDDKSVNVSYDPAKVTLATLKSELDEEGYPVQE